MKCKGMRIATSDRPPMTYMLGSEQLNVVSLEKDLGIVVLNFTSTLHLLLPRRIRFWVSFVSPLNTLILIPYLDFIKLWFAQLLNMPIQFGVPFTLVIRGC